MPAYQIHRLKETQRQQFRWAPHTPGVTIVKLKDYQPGQIVEAATPYALWLSLRESADAILVGDLIEVVVRASAEGAAGDAAFSATDAGGENPALTAQASGDLNQSPARMGGEQGPGGELRILKYIGFEEARWYVPEPTPAAAREPIGVS